MKQIVFLAFLMGSCSNLLSQFDVVWEKEYGGSGTEQIEHLVQTSDGGLLASGFSRSLGMGQGDANAYLLRLDNDGDIVWQRSYGGSDLDEVKSVIEVDDGFVFAGITRSFDGDVSAFLGSIDAWLVKVDFDGNLIWERTFGGQNLDCIYDLIEASDGSYLAVGDSSSDDAGLSIDGSSDMMLIKVRPDGELVWIKSYDKNNIVDTGKIIIQNDDGSFMIGGTTASCEFSQSGVPCMASYWLIKINTEGEIVWDKTYGNVSGENLYLNTLKLVTGRGYFMGGTRGEDAWIISTDLDGNILWNQTVGGVGIEDVFDIAITPNNHVIGAGYSTSGSTGAPIDNANRLVFEINDQGVLSWKDLIGDDQHDEYAWAIEPLPDGCFVLAGRSTVIGDPSQASIVKLGPRLSKTYRPDPKPTLHLYPNPSHEKITVRVDAQFVGTGYTIFNLEGQQVSQGQLESTTLTVPIKEWPTGIYNFTLNHNSLITQSFVKH